MFLRRRDVANDLAVSESQVVKWERQGVIAPVRIPGIRAVRYRADDVRRLADNIQHGRLSTEPAA
jgi:hypothetical protein